MTRVLGPERVPAGFVITTEACVAYLRDGELPDGVEQEVDEALERLERAAEKRLGDPSDPLLVSVRSGARVSMPGMLDTVLNLGLGDEAVRGLAERTDDPRFAWDSYRRLLQMFGGVVRGLASSDFEDALGEAREAAGAKLDTDLDAEDLERLCERFKEIIAAASEPFPQDPREQLREAVVAVFESWNGRRARSYRRLESIPDDWGTAVNVQRMAFGNRGETSGSGVAFSRNETTGEPEPSGRLPLQLPGRGRGRGDSKHRRARRPRGAAAGGAFAADGGTRDAREPLRGHAGRRVHGRGRRALPLADASRQAPRPGLRAVRMRRGRRGAARPRGGDRDDRRRVAGGAPAPRVRPRPRVHRARQGGAGLAGRGAGRGGVHRRRGGGAGGGRRRRDPRATVHRG